MNVFSVNINLEYAPLSIRQGSILLITRTEYVFLKILHDVFFWIFILGVQHFLSTPLMSVFYSTSNLGVFFIQLRYALFATLVNIFKGTICVFLSAFTMEVLLFSGHSLKVFLTSLRLHHDRLSSSACTMSTIFLSTPTGWVFSTFIIGCCCLFFSKFVHVFICFVLFLFWHIQHRCVFLNLPHNWFFFQNLKLIHLVT